MQSLDRRQMLRSLSTLSASLPLLLDLSLLRVHCERPGGRADKRNEIRELPGWWWTCGYCTLSNDASFYVPGSSEFPYATAMMAPDGRSGPEARVSCSQAITGSKLIPKGPKGPF